MSGAPCSDLTRVHETSEQICGGISMLAPRVVKCPSWGTRYEIGERCASAADDASDRLGTTRQVAGFLRTITVEVGGQTSSSRSPSTASTGGGGRGGRGVPHGSNLNGHSTAPNSVWNGA